MDQESLVSIITVSKSFRSLALSLKVKLDAKMTSNIDEIKALSLFKKARITIHSFFGFLQFNHELIVEILVKDYDLDLRTIESCSNLKILDVNVIVSTNLLPKFEKLKSLTLFEIIPYYESDFDDSSILSLEDTIENLSRASLSLDYFSLRSETPLTERLLGKLKRVNKLVLCENVGISCNNLKLFSRIQELIITDYRRANGMNYDFFRFLGGTLVDLDLEDTTTKTEDIETLTNLRNLRLDSTCVKSIASIAPNLVNLSLCFNPIDKDCFKLMVNLKKLTVYHRDEDTFDYKAALPECTRGSLKFMKKRVVFNAL